MERFSIKVMSTIAASCLVASGFILAASSADTKFAKTAARGGMAEVKLGQLASEKATSPEVKAFGQQMVEDHGKANNKLQTIAQQESLSLPDDMDAKQKALYGKLSLLSGASFDKAYVDGMVKDHQEDVQEFSREANAGSDSQIKQFASDTLPVIQGHLEKIKNIQAKLGSAGSM